MAAGPAAPRSPTGRSFSFAISRAMGTVVVTTHGILDQDGARVLGDALLDLVDHQGNLTVIVDVADLRLLDHQCLVPLEPAASAAERRGSRLTFADPSDGMEWALMLTGLAGLIAVTAPSRMRSPHPPKAAPGADNARLAAMAQHPAGSGRPRAAAIPTHEAAQKDLGQSAAGSPPQLH